ncbi:MAG: CHAD domain-containing protein [Anaerolineae bacterium]|nr:CHAD domain-containing protein [Anaerolineae bacterium]
MPDLKFNLPAEYTEREILDQLANHYPLKREASTAEWVTFYDTFDWRLYNASLILYESGNQLFLRELSQPEPIQQVEITISPVFAKDFPQGQLKTCLTPILAMRALLKLVEVDLHSTPYRVLNRDEKTVVWLTCHEISPSGGQGVVTTWLQLQPVRGYDQELQQVAGQLLQLGCTPTDKDTYFLALESVGRQPGDYSARLNVQLDPAMRADEAAKVLLRFLLKVMQRNEAYLKEDIDTEFLHDFRVAVRRTRSALSQIKDVFPPQTTGRFRQDFAFIGQLSNELRDLDVYLLAEDDYRAMLPDVLHDGIAPLFDYLRQKRTRALQNVVSGLNSKRYAQIIKDWELFLAESPPDSPAAGKARLPIIELAQNRIYKRYRRIVKSGRRILENTQDEQLHALRIECKKLRYLLEFFTSLFPADKITTLIKQLKRLQDNLGDFNDLCVQEEYLLKVAQELPLNNQQSRQTLLAIGSLVGRLDQERQQVKGEFAQTFITFASPANKALFKELFAITPKEAAP